MSDKSYAEILLEKIEGNAYSDLNEAILDLIHEDLLQRGYGNDLTRAKIDFITTNNDNMDYSLMLNIPEDSEWAKKFLKIDLKDAYEKIGIVDTYAADIYEFFSSGINVKNALDENGRLTKAGRDELKDVLDSYLNISANLSDNIAVVGTAYSSLIDFVNQDIDSLLKLCMDMADAGDLKEYVLDKEYGDLTSPDIPIGWYGVWEGIYDSNPSWWIATAITPDNPNNATLTWEEVYRLYNKYPEHSDVLDPYIEWRINYEYQMALEDALEKKGLTLEEYAEQLKKEAETFEEPNWFVKGFNKFKHDFFDDYIALSEIEEINPVSDKVKGKYLSEVKTQTLTASNTVYDPIILDLDSDGFNVETKENGTNFDLDKNSFAEKINWTSKDGFLCLDLNNNGTIDDGGELFGDNTLLADGTEATNGFEALAQYDSNSDGVIDENDEIYSSLRVWVDGDGDGISAGGELKTLADLGITSINLAYENVNAETGTEATIGNSATFTYADGTVGNAGELWVSSDLFDTVDKVDIEIPDDIKDLPNVGSIGNVYSLHNAMALDETGELKALVESFAAEQDMDKRMETVQKILYFITGANDVADGSRGSYMDAKQLAVIEAMLGEAYVGTTGRNPHIDAAPMLKEAYADLLNMYYNELNAQTYIKDYVQLLRYTENEDGTKTLNADLVNYILEYQLANGDENAKGILADVARYVQYLDNGGIKGMAAFVENYMTISSEYAAEIVKFMPNGYVADGVNSLNGTMDTDYLAGSANGETINAGNGSDVIIGGKGDDKLYGSYGNDTYVFNLGDGNDIIEDYAPSLSNSKADKIVFGEGITLEDITVDRSGNDMILRIKDTEDSIRIVNQYTNEYYRVENFEFADGTTVMSDYFYNIAVTVRGSGKFNDYTGDYGNKNSIIYGSDIADTINAYEGNDHIETGLGNDIVYGGNGADTFVGGNGDDKLFGSYDNDTYIFNLGDGNDIIEDYAPSLSNSKADKVVFGEGISLEDIIVDRTGNDMILRIKDTEDSIRIVNQYTNEYYRVENFEFADGTTVAASHFFNTPITITGNGEFNDYTGGFGINSTTIYGSDIADTINAYEGNDHIETGLGNDIVYGGNGADTFIGGNGDDTLCGSYDNDTYIFNLGDGNDIIEDYAPSLSNSKADKVVFGEGISLENIIVDRTGNDMILRIKDTEDSIRIVNQYTNEYYRVENFKFADGTTVTSDYFYNFAVTVCGSGKFNDYTGDYGNKSSIIYGSDVADTINAYEGNDYIETGLGNDIVYGGNGADTFVGGNGDDKLFGSYDNDTYIFNLGDGNDTIEDYAPSLSNSKADKVVFGEGISLEDIIVDRTGNDMILRIKNTEDSIRIVNQYTNEYYRVENFEFADGTTVSASYFFNTLITINGSGVFDDYTGGYGINSTTIYGSDIADTINAYEGNDYIKTGLDDDIVYGGNGSDTLVGGKGNDTLYGGYDNDTYIFNLGDGNDTIEDYAPSLSNSKADKVVFGDEISLEDIIVDRTGNDMILRIKDTDDSIRIVNQYTNEYYRVENFEFADGTTVAASHFFNTPITITGSGKFNDYTGGFGNNSTTIYGSDIADTINAYEGNDYIETGLGNDIVYGGNGADTFIGGNGNDKLLGSYDNDTYIFNLGDGNDTIEDYAPSLSNSKADKVVFGEEISIDDIIFSKSGNNLVIGFNDTDDSITITNHNSNDYYRVENFATSDGYTIDYSKVNQLIQAMASFEADTGMSWTEAIEQGNETANSIVSEMWVKSVS